MKKLIVALSAIAMSLGIASQAQAYYNGGVSVTDHVCNYVSPNYTQDKAWYVNLGIEEHGYESSLEYHRMRSNGNNYSAAAVCWMEDRSAWGIEDLSDYLENFLGFVPTPFACRYR